MKHFLDEITITVQSGRGGSGCESYAGRTDRKFVPSGGDGGKGGDVILRADSETRSLVTLKTKRVFQAESGGAGSGNNCYGRNGKPFIINTPCGTTVYDQNHNLLLRDLVEDGDEVVVAKGGRGGYGNHARRPSTRAEDGVTVELTLSFTIIADIFLVGLPNSGKTELLRRLTGARIEPTEYPFATNTPLLGTHQGASSNLKICELPALYGRSSDGRGLGTLFLKHLKRAKLIFLVLDPTNSFADGIKAGYDILLKQIEQFDHRFLKIPRLVVVNKYDLPEAKKALTKKKIKLKDPIFEISALTGLGVEKLMKKAVKILNEKKS